MHHLLWVRSGHLLPFPVPAIISTAGTFEFVRHVSCPFVLLLFLLEKVKEAVSDVRYVGREAGCREVKPEYSAYRRVPGAQARIPAQNEYHRAEHQRR
jgi:hypothetical protein